MHTLFRTRIFVVLASFFPDPIRREDVSSKQRLGSVAASHECESSLYIPRTFTDIFVSFLRRAHLHGEIAAMQSGITLGNSHGNIADRSLPVVASRCIGWMIEIIIVVIMSSPRVVFTILNVQKIFKYNCVRLNT